MYLFGQLLCNFPCLEEQLLCVRQEDQPTEALWEQAFGSLTYEQGRPFTCPFLKPECSLHLAAVPRTRLPNILAVTYLCNTFLVTLKQSIVQYFISPKHVCCIQKEQIFFTPTDICSVKLHIIKLQASLNYLEYNALNKPQIIVIKAVETLQDNGWSTIAPCKMTVAIRDVALQSRKPTEEPQNWQRGDCQWAFRYRISTHQLSQLISVQVGGF